MKRANIDTGYHEECREALQEVVDQIARKIQKLDQENNSEGHADTTEPILVNYWDMLPNELVEDIFVRALGNEAVASTIVYEYTGKPTTSDCLSSVCRRFRLITSRIQLLDSLGYEGKFAVPELRKLLKYVSSPHASTSRSGAPRSTLLKCFMMCITDDSQLVKCPEMETLFSTLTNVDELNLRRDKTTLSITDFKRDRFYSIFRAATSIFQNLFHLSIDDGFAFAYRPTQSLPNLTSLKLTFLFTHNNIAPFSALLCASFALTELEISFGPESHWQPLIGIVEIINRQCRGLKSLTFIDESDEVQFDETFLRALTFDRSGDDDAPKIFEKLKNQQHFLNSLEYLQIDALFDYMQGNYGANEASMTRIASVYLRKLPNLKHLDLPQSDQEEYDNNAPFLKDLQEQLPKVKITFKIDPYNEEDDDGNGNVTG